MTDSFVQSNCTFSAGILSTESIVDEIGLLLAEADRAGVARHLTNMNVNTFLWDCPIRTFTSFIDISLGGFNTGDISLAGGSTDSTWDTAEGLSGDVFTFNGGNAVSAANLTVDGAPDRITTESKTLTMSVPFSSYCPSDNVYQYL